MPRKTVKTKLRTTIDQDHGRRVCAVLHRVRGTRKEATGYADEESSAAGMGRDHRRPPAVVPSELAAGAEVKLYLEASESSWRRITNFPLIRPSAISAK